MAHKTKKVKQCRAEGCNNTFTPYLSTQKYCSAQCTYTEHKKGKKPTKIKPVSSKRLKEMKIYAEKRKAFLKDNPKCAVYPQKKATEIHHKKGRIGKLYLDDRFWLAVSRSGHVWIENNPIEAKKRGFSLDRLTIN